MNFLNDLCIEAYVWLMKVGEEYPAIHLLMSSLTIQTLETM